MELEQIAARESTPQLLNKLQELLMELQSRSVGLADIDGAMIPIVEHHKQSDKITVVKLSALLTVGVMVLQRDSANKAILFTENQTMKDYVKAPVAFNKVVKQLQST